MTHRIVPIRVLGPVEISLEGETASLGGPKQRAVLAMLVSRASSVVTTDELVDGIWGEDPPRAVLASLHTYVSNLRASVGYPIQRHGSAYRLDAEPADIDACVFEADVELGQRHLIANPAVATETLRGALALWRGRAYADVSTFPGVYHDAIRLDELRLSAVESRIESDLNLGRHGVVVGELETLAAQYPLRESLRAKHMIALYRGGRQGEALRAFRRTQEYLRDELGVDPSDQLQDLEARILDHDYTLMHAREVVNENLALLFTQIAHASSLWEAHRNDMRPILADQNELIHSAIDQAGGAVIRSSGDGLIAAFPETAMAARAAVAAQRGLAARDRTPLDLTVRMAIDMGEIERRGGDFFGPPMNRGSRLVATAHGGQILLSSDAQAELGRERGTQIKSLGEYRLNGLPGAQEVYQLVDEGLRADFPALRTFGAQGGLTRGFGDGIAGYELREPLGRTTFTTVFRGYQASVGREVAVKVIEPEVSNHPDFIRRFESEARFVASLEHPHILSVYDYWRDADGAYLVTPLMTGGDMDKRSHSGTQPDRVLAIAAQLGSALSHAHRHGVTHGDIKPSNVLFDSDGNAYLADFGTAIRAANASNGALLPSSDFTAPENRGRLEVDVASDIYSLAAVIAHLATGGRPGADLSALDLSLQRALERGLTENPDDRPGSVDELLKLVPSLEKDGPVGTLKTFRNPFKGLAAFLESDASDFYGRSDEIRRLAALVAEHRLSAVVGPSGSGKSSLVQAGLVPALRNGVIPHSETWVITRTVPGTHPFDELATSLSAVSTESRSELAADLAASDGKGLLRASKRIDAELDGELVVVVDQFEELFTLVSSEEIRGRFVTTLVTATRDLASRVRVILTLRADFFHEALGTPVLGPIISVAHLALTPPDSDQALEAIVVPATGAGLELEPGLPARMLSDLADQPGSLPLLQFTLDRLATTADAGLITNADYDTLGGVNRAIAEQAEAALDQLSDGQEEVARRIFTRLLTVSEDTHDLRRRVTINELRSLGLPERDVEAVLDTFGQERLLTFDVDATTRDATVEVAHEALIREWPKLRSWVESRRDSLVLQRRFQQAFAEWQDSGRDPDNLLVGGKLSQHEEWAATEDVSLTLVEREFLDASVTRRENEIARRRTSRRRMIGTFAVAALVFMILGGLALWQRGVAQTEARQEEVRRLAASSTIALSDDPELAILLALEAVDVSRRVGQPVRPEAAAALHQALQTSRVDMRLGSDMAVGFGREGELVTAQQLGPVTGGLPPVAILSPDGRLFAERVTSIVPGTSDEVGEIVIWDATGRNEVVRIQPRTPTGQRMYVGLSVQWHPSGERIVAQVIDATGDSSIRIWDVASGDEVGVSFDTFSNNSSYAFIEEQTMAVAHPNGDGVLFYDLDSGDVVDRLETPDFVTQYVAHDPIRNWLIVGSQQSTPIQAWDLDSREIVWSIDLASSFWPTIHAETGIVALGGWDGVMRLLDIEDGAELAALRGHTAETRAALFSPDGASLVSRTVGETLLWDLSTAGPRAVGAIDIGSSTPYGIRLSPEGDEMAVLTADSIIRYDIPTGRPAGDPLPDDLISPVLSSDWRLVAALDDQGRGWVYEVETLDPVMELPACTSPRNFNTAGTAIAVDWLVDCEAAPGELLYSRVIAVPSGEELLDLGEDPLWDSPGGVFNPGGVFEADRYLAVNRKNRVEIYDVAEPHLITTLDRSSDDVLGMTFDPTGRYLALGGGNIGGWVIDMEQITSGVPAEEALVFDDPVDPGGVPAVDINSDEILATSAFGSLRLWDIASGEQIIQVPVDTTDPAWAVFNASGDELFYVDQTDSGYVLRRFLMNHDELISLAESRVTRGFTTDECRRFDLDSEACPPTDAAT